MDQKQENRLEETRLGETRLGGIQLEKLLTAIRRGYPIEPIIESEPFCTLLQHGDIKLGTKIGEGTYGEVFLLIKSEHGHIAIDTVIKRVYDPQPSTCITKHDNIFCTSEINEALIGTVLSGFNNVGIPFFLRYFAYFTCGNDQAYLLSERAHGSLYQLMNDHIDLAWRCNGAIFFQIFYALMIAQKCLRFTHYDLKPDNILLYRLTPGDPTIPARYFDDVWHYRVHGRDYYVPNPGFIIKISDFSWSRVDNPVGGLIAQEIAPESRDHRDRAVGITHWYTPLYDIMMYTHPDVSGEYTTVAREFLENKYGLHYTDKCRITQERRRNPTIRKHLTLEVEDFFDELFEYYRNEEVVRAVARQLDRTQICETIFGPIS